MSRHSRRLYLSKFQRSFRIEIDLGDGSDTIIITPPMTVKFTVSRRYQSSLNTLQLSIYNLGKEFRRRIFKDFFDARNRNKKNIRFFAGYKELSLMFEGSIWEAYSQRDGTDIITNIYAKSGAWDIQQTQTYQTLEKGLSVKEILEYLIGEFIDLKKGAVGDNGEIVQRPVVLNGSTYELLKKYSDNKVMIDNGRIYVLQDNEVIEGNLNVISKDTGLLETPRRTEGIIQVLTLFEPRLLLNQKCSLVSEIEPIYNGEYKVIGLVHQGVISEAVNGACTTIADLLIPDGKVFKTVET